MGYNETYLAKHNPLRPHMHPPWYAPFTEFEETVYKVENKVAIIRFNRPEKLNARTRRGYGELIQCIDQANNDENVRVIVITGTGRAFCTGDDVKSVLGGGTEGQWAGVSQDEQAKRWRERILEYLQSERWWCGGNQLMFINKPSIAAVNGIAVGLGMDISLMCDMRVASDKASFCEIHSKAGCITDESQLILPRLVGYAKALELTLTAETIDAAEAYRIGLVNKVVPHDDLMKATMELAGKIAQWSPITTQLHKEGLRKSIDMPYDAWKQWYSLASVFCLESEDFQEASKAFVEKRKPVFKGR